MNKLFEAIIRLTASYANRLPLRSRLHSQLVMFGQKDVVREREAPANQNILVLAPHMDDEIFGCGGTLTICARQHALVTVVYLTDGRKGYDSKHATYQSATDQVRFEDRLVETRKAEARSVSELLRLQPPVFLDLPDGRLRVYADSISRLARVLDRYRPSTVFLPYLTDPHQDHWATIGIFLKAAEQSRLAQHVECWGYEVWAPLLANTIVDITEVMKEKEAAMLQYRTQAAVCDFPRVFSGLSMYRSMFTQRGRGFAEGFWVVDVGTYHTLYQAATRFRLPSLPADFRRNAHE